MGVLMTFRNYVATKLQAGSPPQVIVIEAASSLPIELQNAGIKTAILFYLTATTYKWIGQDGNNSFWIGGGTSGGPVTYFMQMQDPRYISFQDKYVLTNFKLGNTQPNSPQNGFVVATTSSSIRTSVSLPLGEVFSDFVNNAILATVPPAVGGSADITVSTYNFVGDVIGRRYRATVEVPCFSNTTNDRMRAGISFDSSIVAYSTVENQYVGGSDVHSLRAVYEWTETTDNAAHTIITTIARFGGSGQITAEAFATVPYRFTIDDIGGGF